MSNRLQHRSPPAQAVATPSAVHLIVSNSTPLVVPYSAPRSSTDRPRLVCRWFIDEKGRLVSAWGIAQKMQ